MIAVVACGNLVRGDDGVGPHVLAQLRRSEALRERDDLKLVDAATDGMAVLYQARGCRELIVIDASRSGAEPGSVFRVPGDAFDEDVALPRDSHALRWDHAIAIGRRVFASQMPRRVTVYLIEVQATDFGMELSPAVAAAADRLTRQLVTELAATGLESPS